MTICIFCKIEPVRILSSGKLSVYCSRTCASKHGNKISADKKKQTFLKNYGVDNPSKSKAIKDKKIKTCQKNFGVDHPGQSSVVKDRCKATCLERFGETSPMKTTEVKDKLKSVFLKKYGVDNASKSQVVKDLIQDKALKSWKDSDIKDERLAKRKKTNLKKYGVEWNSQRKEHTGLVNATSLERYGTSWPMQNEDIHDKSSKNSKLFKDYIMPSGNVVRIQGYEHMGLDMLLKEFVEEDIVVKRKLIPNIDYYFNNKLSKYRADMYIPLTNLLIEVKSTYTYNKDLKKNLAKESAAINAGYNFKFMIFDAKGNLCDK